MSNAPGYESHAQQTIARPQAKGTAVLVLGIVGFFIGICSIIGLVIGLQRKGKVKRGELAYSGTLQAGVVLCIVSLVLNVLGFVFTLANH